MDEHREEREELAAIQREDEEAAREQAQREGFWAVAEDLSHMTWTWRA